MKRGDSETQGGGVAPAREAAGNNAGGERDFLAKLVAADRRAQSWREKLEGVRSLLADDQTEFGEGELASVAVYLRFLGTGAIACREDGRHFRPMHHARIAQRIRERLERLATPATALVLRKIYPWLPSSAAPFQRAEPLTRIREIAHRNDIPPDLKREIKHSLQNKLHRCAGPEDLATSEALLDRISAPGANYPAGFVEQFKVFHAELKHFFNAGTLEERLEALAARGDAATAALIHSFLKQKRISGGQERICALATLTELRRHCLAQVDRLEGDPAEEYRLADIGLEDFAFVLVSDLLNGLEREASDWSRWLETLRLTVANLALSQVEPEECGAIEAEVRAWSADFRPEKREDLLRLKASVGRARRLAEEQSDRMAGLFLERAQRLGRELGVAEPAVRVFCEAEIRSHLIFQLAKVATGLLHHTRQALRLPPWDVLVSGQAGGRVEVRGRLGQPGNGPPGPVLALVRRAEGDEEIPAGVTGIVLAQEMPHLSHLGVRARQAGVVLVACEEAKAFEELCREEGRVVRLTTTAETVVWEATERPVLTGQKRPVRVPQPPARREASGRLVLPLVEVEAGSGGGKVEGARDLARLATRESADFHTPRSLAIPFGAMESVLEGAPGVKAEYERVLRVIDQHDGERFFRAVDQLRDLTQHAKVPESLVEGASRLFGSGERLMVRSSSNCEDLAEMSGAGLYESVANVPVTELASAVRAVWASLWTRRAALSRKQAGIPQGRARMAVLIQQMLEPELSFVMHTVNPLTGEEGELYVELAVGLGETLVSGARRGNPYRLICDKYSGETRIGAFANFSQGLWPAPEGGIIGKGVDYSRMRMSLEPEFRAELGRRLAAIGRLVEAEFGRPQDIEGVVVDSRIYLVQARPQPGLERVRRSAGKRAGKGGAAEAERQRAEPSRPAGERIEAPRSRERAPAPERPRTYGLFEKRIEGDNCLMELARRRFQQAGMGAEMHGVDPAGLEWYLQYRPTPETPVMVHLPRELNLREESSRARILEFASHFAGRVQGLVVHDHADLVDYPQDYLRAAGDLDARLQAIDSAPRVFIEYAAGLDPARFAGFFHAAAGLSGLGVGLDTGHVGIWQARQAYARRHPGEDVCALKDQPELLRERIGDVEAAVNSALEAVRELIRDVAASGQAVHFHLHDGHPLSTFSPFGVSDHLSFLSEMPLNFEYRGRRAVPLMFGGGGLSRIVAEAMDKIPSGRLSFTLEIHPTDERRDLGDESPLFAHWRDKTNAERMNHWLWTLCRNHELLSDVIALKLEEASA